MEAAQQEDSHKTKQPKIAKRGEKNKIQLVDRCILKNKKYKREHTTKCEATIEKSKAVKEFMCQKKDYKLLPSKKTHQ